MDGIKKKEVQMKLSKKLIVLGGVCFFSSVYSIKITDPEYGLQRAVGKMGEMGSRSARITADILGSAQANILIIDNNQAGAKQYGVTNTNIEYWAAVLDELGKYIELNQVDASEANKKLFASNLRALRDLSNNFFNTVKLLYNTKIRGKAHVSAAELQGEINSLKASREKLNSLRSNLKPGWTDYAKTKEIKETITRFIVALDLLYERAIKDEKKFGN
jgi:hypothetical protein